MKIMMKFQLPHRIPSIKKFEKSLNRLVYKCNNTSVQNIETSVMCTVKTHFFDSTIKNFCHLIKKIFWQGLKNVENNNSVMPVKEIRTINSDAAVFLLKKGTNVGKPEENEREASKSNLSKYTFRTHTCGELRPFHIGKKVRLMGWVQFIRNDKFILIRDCYGITQLYIPEERRDLLKFIEAVTLESVIYAEGIVERRPSGQENPKFCTGDIEIIVTNLKILSEAKELPFQINEFNVPNETIRMKFRYLDLRHKFMQDNLRFRSNILHKIRCFLIENLNFVEVETPTLFKKTPGGAQEFIVPTVKKEKFYSLVQSPQQFKQLLMIGSIDRYFQIARCYRDESGTNDRQPEFTQLDIEMSFCQRDDVLNLIEDLLKYCWPEHLPPLITPFQRITYDEALNFYGTDKPDLRFNWKLKNLTSIFTHQKENCKGKYNVHELINKEDFGAFAVVGRQGEAKFTDKLKKNILNEVSSSIYPNVKHLFFAVKGVEKVRETLKMLFCPSVASNIEQVTQYEKGDVLFLALGTKENVLKSLGKIRIYFAQNLEENQTEVMEKNIFKFLWVLDFPMFEKKNSDIESVHHPFTQPHPNDISFLENEPLKVRSLHYDLVLNGNEIGGGSIRINDPELQKMILENILKIQTDSLSHLLKGLASGAPPHGGIALGIDRLIAILCGTNNIRDVMAFPKGRFGNDFMSDAPSEISKEDKVRYHIQ